MVSKVRNVRLGVFSGGGCHHPNPSDMEGMSCCANQSVEMFVSIMCRGRGGMLHEFHAKTYALLCIRMSRVWSSVRMSRAPV